MMLCLKIFLPRIPLKMKKKVMRKMGLNLLTYVSAIRFILSIDKRTSCFDVLYSILFKPLVDCRWYFGNQRTVPFVSANIDVSSFARYPREVLPKKIYFGILIKIKVERK